MNVPADLKYTEEHEWVMVEGNIATVGITDYAQSELGDIVFVELPGEGDQVTRMETFGTIEAVKAVSEMFSPLSGKINAVNSTLEDDPIIINHDPYGDGWMIKIDLSDPSQLDQLLDAAGYRSIIRQ